MLASIQSNIDVPSGNIKHRKCSYPGPNQRESQTAQASGCSPDTTRNAVALVPGMTRSKQTVVDSCSRVREFLLPNFQGDITKVSYVLKIMCEGCPVSALVSITKWSF